MTKEITKAFILQQMQDKFGLRDFEPTPFLFDETVVPVYLVEQHLEEWWNKYVDTVVSSLGARLVFTIPDNERWHLKGYDVVFMTGVFTIAGVYIQRKNQEPSGAYMYLDLTAGQNVSYHQDTDVILTRGDAFKINVDGYTSTGTIRLLVDFKREILR